MADDKEKKLNIVDLYVIGKMLAHLVAENMITCNQRDKIALGVMQKHDLDPEFSDIAGVGLSKEATLERFKLKESLEPSRIKSDGGYVSLTELAQAHSSEAPGYVIQSWLRSGNTLAFLNLWEKENNPDYCEDAYMKLMAKKKEASFTLTPKMWISQTKAIGLRSKQGKSGGTFAHVTIACEFASWLTPEFKMLLLKLSLERTQLKKDELGGENRNIPNGGI